MTLILPVESTPGATATVTIAEGESATLCLMGSADDGVPRNAEVAVQFQEGSIETTWLTMNRELPLVRVTAVGTHILKRIGGTVGVSQKPDPA